MSAVELGDRFSPALLSVSAQVTLARVDVQLVVDFTIANQILLVLVLVDGMDFLDVVWVFADLSIHVDDMHLGWWCFEAGGGLRCVRVG